MPGNIDDVERKPPPRRGLKITPGEAQIDRDAARV